MISFWALAAIINCATSLSLGILVYLRNRTDARNITYGLFTLSLTIWSACYFFWQVSSTEAGALFWCRALMAAAIFLPITYLHHILIFIGRIKSIRNQSIIHFYLTGFLLSVLCFSPWAVTDVRPRMMFLFWPSAGDLLLPIILIWLTFVVQGILELVSVVKNSVDPDHRRQAIYLLVATIVGWSGGVTNFPLWYDIPIPPFGNIFISLYVIIVFYAIVRYRLMDIRVAISSAGIFLAIYSLVLGVPFFFYVKGYYFLAFCSLIIFTTPAPFIYIFLRKRAEGSIFIKERKYQNLLLQSTRVLGRLKSTSEITNFIVDTIYRVVQPKHIALYLFDGSSYILTEKAGDAQRYLREVNFNAPLISYCKCFGAAFMDDLRLKGGLQDLDCFDNSGNDNPQVSIIIPIKRDKDVTGFVLLGVKQNAFPYSNQDLSVLSSVVDSMLITLENAHYRKEEDERRIREDALVRREFLDQIVSVMSHEINNPNQAVIMGLGTIQSCARLYLENPDPQIIKAIIEMAEETERTACSISSLVDNIREFSQEHRLEIKPMDISKTLPVLEVIGKTILKKYPDTCLNKEIQVDLPLVLADKVPIEEILLNYLSNACHAVRNNAPGCRCITLRIGVIPEQKLRIEFIDNGYGISSQVLRNLFQIPTTTKGSNEGTGLGIWRVRKICDAIGAQYGAHSDGVGKGARFWVDLQIA